MPSQDGRGDLGNGLQANVEKVVEMQLASMKNSIVREVLREIKEGRGGVLPKPEEVGHSYLPREGTIASDDSLQEFVVKDINVTLLRHNELLQNLEKRLYEVEHHTSGMKVFAPGEDEDIKVLNIVNLDADLDAGPVSALQAKLPPLPAQDRSFEERLQAHAEVLKKHEQRLHEIGEEMGDHSQAGEVEDVAFTEEDTGSALIRPQEKNSEITRNTTNTRSKPVGRRSFLRHATSAYVVQSSIWDGLLFIGTGYLPLGASVVLTVCFLFNLFLLAMFLGMVYTQFMESDFDSGSETELTLWRSTVAHDVLLRNSITGESLASGVCTEKISLPYSNLQSILFRELDKYLAKPVGDLGWDLTAGALMCSLALVCWYLTLLAEVRDIFDEAGAFLDLPYVEGGFIELIGSKTLRLNGLTKRRKTVMIFIWFLRLFELGMLAWAGSMFLIYTADVREILLNATALELILRLDEGIFNALAPKVVHTMVLNLLPVEIERTCNRWHTYAESLSMGVVMLGTLTFAYFSQLMPFVDVLFRNREAICGGKDKSSFDFVIATDTIGIPWASRSAAKTDDLWAYASQAVQEVLKEGWPDKWAATGELTNNVYSNLGKFLEVASPERLENLKENRKEFKRPQEWDIVDIYNWDFTAIGWDEIEVLSGKDYGDQQGTVYNYYLRNFLKVSDASVNVTCADVPLARCVAFGTKASDLAMRKLCPIRCGCSDPTRGAVGHPVTITGFLGCPRVMSLRQKELVDVIRKMPCVDTVSNDTFAVFAAGFGTAGASTKFGSLQSRAIVAYQKGGCTAVAAMVGTMGGATQKGDEHWGINLCTDTVLPTICPVSCGCNTTIKVPTSSIAYRNDYCPASCQNPFSKPLCMTTTEFTKEGRKYVDKFGPQLGQACLFPFQYKGKTYNHCMSADWFRPWCATTIDNGIIDRWGECEDAPQCSPP